MFEIFALPGRVAKLERSFKAMSDQLANVVARLQASLDKAIAEKVEVFDAIAEFKSDVESLRLQVAELQAATPPEVDLGPVLAMVDVLDSHIEGIYVPTAEEESEPVEPTPEGPGVEV